VFLLFRPGTEQDTQQLVAGSSKALQCIRNGQWGHCPEADRFTIFQYIPCWIVELLGASEGFTIHILAYLSMCAAVLSFREMYMGLKGRSLAVAWSGVLVLGTGFWLRYANLSSNEMLASFVTLMFVSSYLRGKKIWISALFLYLATLTKDTAFPFLLAWTVVLVLCASEPVRILQEKLKAGLFLVSAVILGVVTNLCFNFFRFGTWISEAYLNPNNIVHDGDTQISFFFAQWFSPTGGLLFFWGSFCCLVVLLSIVLTRIRGASRRTPGIMVILILFGTTLGFSKWYAPLGGYCWGARFFLPWLSGLAFYVLWSYSAEFEALLKAWSVRPILFWGISTGIAVFAFPQYVFLLRQSLIGKVLDVPACAGLRDYPFERCVFWPPFPWGILRFYEPFPRPDLFVLAVFMSTCVIWLCLKIKNTE
jgi:hypothetical protein